MSIPKEVLSELKCCFHNDGHIAIESILVSCDAIGCKEYIRTSKKEVIECFKCKGQHPTGTLKNFPVIKAFEEIFKLNASDSFEYSKVYLEKKR